MPLMMSAITGADRFQKDKSKGTRLFVRGTGQDSASPRASFSGRPVEAL